MYRSIKIENGKYIYIYIYIAIEKGTLYVRAQVFRSLFNTKISTAKTPPVDVQPTTSKSS